MINAGELKKGTALELDGEIYQLTDFHHIKMGRGSALIRLRLRNIRSNNTIERSFQASDKFTPAFLEHRSVQYLYNDNDLHYFMDNESYEQTALTADHIGEVINYLKEGATLDLLTYGSEVVSIELPAAVELQVTETDPGFKGNTATAGSKPAKLETGITIQVPLFINTEDIIKVDTRSGEYLERAS